MALPRNLGLYEAMLKSYNKEGALCYALDALRICMCVQSKKH